MASALKIGYKEIYDSNEYAHELSKEKLTALITQITGAEKDSRATQATVSTFFNLKKFAAFDKDEELSGIIEQTPTKNLASVSPVDKEMATENVKLNLSYTINLNLPETSNPEVFNAIFKSLKENLLKDQ